MKTNVHQIFLLLWLFLPQNSEADTITTALADVDVSQHIKFKDLPSMAPQPILYFLKNARTPSCGLISPRQGDTRITPILETEHDQDFPYCEKVRDWAMFKQEGVPVYVFRYLQRDTRENSSTAYFFVEDSAGRLRPLEILNSATVPQNKTMQHIVAWAKLKLKSKGR